MAPQLQLKDNSLAVYSAVHGKIGSMRVDLSKPFAPREFVTAEEAKIPRCQRPAIIAAASLADQPQSKTGIEPRIRRILEKQARQPASLSAEETFALNLYKEWHPINRRKCAMEAKRLREKPQANKVFQITGGDSARDIVRAQRIALETGTSYSRAIARRAATQAKAEKLAREKRLKKLVRKTVRV